MYNFEINKSKRDKLLNEINFTNRQREIFTLLTNGVKRADISNYIGCCERTISYEIKKISDKISRYENNIDGVTYNVYIHIFPNGKKYVGMCENINFRWGNYGIPYNKNIRMYEDIIKYGWENIKHEILITTTSSFKARELEHKLIEIFDLTDDEKGYNKTT